MTTLTVIETLRKARQRVENGTHSGVFEAVRSLEGEASGLTRDCVYYALLDTVAAGEAAGSIASLHRTNGAALALLDATIARLTAKLH
ncbi:hypothetical protein PQJ75_02610 [Rhodoplanes sp. TEM]|uniref:Uncharacterized protein n=1 Tax=Rhodoplanes tepidamans TaxID=200616 RepID=A0ABT5J660_RHOTP|nr:MULTISPECIES: hypothetical protein [Rhodoplanes]MDC7785139.1 hypothetical protein [Rhodoplanes tepidamans]MDC7982613.1 hypothetical protein [Rhodoplanes sp. TEM]MDQ0356629.1 hypothetical protein [Rhodoplanes tepidamans]